MGFRRAASLTVLGALTALVGLVRFAIDPPDGALVGALGLVTTALAGEWTLRRWRNPKRLDIDPTGLLRADAFERVLDERVAIASQELRPLSLVLLELHQREWSPPSAFAGEVALLRGRLLRATDVIARFGEGRLALILEDADEDAAMEAVGRLHEALASARSDADVLAGVASYPRHALAATRLLDRATVALDEARDLGGSVAVAPQDQPD
ncbi:MAG: diguanylate cyclase [Actinomycetota bacterium]